MYIDNETLNDLAKQLMGRFDKIDKTLERIINTKRCFDGDKLLDNQDMCTMLGITKRTLARYRQKNKVRYYHIDKKVYYIASEVEVDLLADKRMHGRKQSKLLVKD